MPILWAIALVRSFTTLLFISLPALWALGGLSVVIGSAFFAIRFLAQVGELSRIMRWAKASLTRRAMVQRLYVEREAIVEQLAALETQADAD